MTRLTHSTVFFLTLVLSITFGALGSASADQIPYHHGHIVVENVGVTPGREGGRSILRFRIINEGYDHEHLLGVETPVAKNARIVGRTGDHTTATFESFGIDADGELDLVNAAMWVELGPLSRTLNPGDSVPLDLVFLRGRVHVKAHVHGADG
jgi:copper(I)-binding protein